MITEKEYSEFVASRLKNPEDISLTPEQKNLIHLAFGISGEAGELLDAIKKHCIYGKELDYVNVAEELGDLEFFMEAMRQHLQIQRKVLLSDNVYKLTKRYEKGYTDEQAIDRKDKS